jgi:deoxyadenosine/deoxycytidine kinase
MPVFTVEGVIGAGKTSFLQKINNESFKKHHIVVLEPVDDWLNLKLDGPNAPSIFEKFYADKNRFGFMFQMYVLQTRVQQINDIVKKNPDAIILCERSQLSDREIFAKMLTETGTICKEEYHVYKLWYDMCEKTLFSNIDGVIYINTLPSKCISRIKQRSRSGEEYISIEYIETLWNLHERFVNSTPLPVCHIDGNEAIDTDKYVDSLKMVIEFCNKFCDDAQGYNL